MKQMSVCLILCSNKKDRPTRVVVLSMHAYELRRTFSLRERGRRSLEGQLSCRDSPSLAFSLTLSVSNWNLSEGGLEQIECHPALHQSPILGEDRVRWPGTM